MNVLILGNGPAEHDWAHWLFARGVHRIEAAYPGFPADPELAGIAIPLDFDDALARAGLDLIIVGGPIESRGESLRRAAADGQAIICLHPPDADSEAYYQVVLSRDETGAVIVPDLPLRLHPGVARLRKALASGELGPFRGLRYEESCEPGESLVRESFARAIDVVRAILGEVEAVTATADPPGLDPEHELIVQVRTASARRAEMRLEQGDDEPTKITLQGTNGSITLEFDADLGQPARLIEHRPGQPDTVAPLEPFDPHAAIFSVLLESRDRKASSLPAPNLQDGTRAMEIVEAVVRSLRRGRTVDLIYEPVSEESTFKSVMTSTGCMILIGSLCALLVALAGPPLGLSGTIYIAYLIPPILAIFAGLQILRVGIKRPGESGRSGSRHAPITDEFER
jgi:myo-inositol 2-dehydrogenase/D-chiro-inositol 1-dehydrogenase